MKIKNYNEFTLTLLFYLIILFLPTQLGKHFWPDFSLILGARIDYLSPTLYLTDIFIIILLLSYTKDYFIKAKSNSKFKIQNSKLQFKIQNYLNNFKLLTIAVSKYKLWLIFIVILMIGIGISKSPLAGVYGLIKIFEFAFFGFYISRKIRSLKELGIVVSTFSIGILFESILAILQFVNQSSIGGVFYFFGERTFSPQTLGIANASLRGELMLRPYGTFSHPNVLAGYLIIGMTTIIFNLKFKILNQFGNISNVKNQISNLHLKSKIHKVFLGLSILVGTAALLLTMSRVAIALWILIALFAIFSFLKNNLKANKFTICYLIFAILTAGSILMLSPIRYRFSDLNFSDESLVVRQDLTRSSMAMIKDSPVFGTGLNNFLQNLSNDQNLKNQNIFTYLQPVHNIYLLIAAELGLTGFMFFLWFYFKTVKKIKNQKSKIKNVAYSLFFIITILGFFDHYFLTIQQGQLLFSFVLGFCWMKYKV